MKTLRTFTIICLLVVALNAVSYAQTDNGTGKVKYNTWSVTLSGGSMLFYGDLRQFDFYPISKQNGKDWYTFTTDISERKMGFGIAVSKQISPIFGVQGEFQKGKLGGVKKGVDAYFTADVLKYGINGIVNFTNLFFPNCKNRSISFYGIAGLEYLDFKTVEKKISTDAEIMSYGCGNYGQEKKQTTELAIPLGLGLKYKLFPKFDLGVECILNNINTDKLDARVRTNTAKDKYGYTAITITYRIGKNEKSLEWVNPKEMESDELTPRFAAISKKIDSLSNKLNDIDSKVGALQKDVAILNNPPKEADDDGDGVPNSKDLEPNTPKGSFVDVNGKAIPTQSSSSISGEATPQFAVFFRVNSSYIDEVNYEKIAVAVKMLRENPNLKFDLVGHADKTGGKLYNEILSKKRAQAVFNLLKSFGIDPSRLIVVGKGIEDPLSNDILSVNRRVDFIIKK
ncbi:MAG: OmpA family protein [Bacteroidales bacterium]